MAISKYNSDYTFGLIKWLQRINDNPPDTSSKLEACLNEILILKDTSLAYFFAVEYNYKTYLLQNLIIEKQDSKYALIFAQDIPYADIRSLQQIVLNSNNPRYIAKFACFVKGADQKPLIKWILNAQDARYTHMLIKNIDEIDLGKCKPVIMKSKKPTYLFELAKHLTKKSDIEDIETLIIESKCFEYIRLFAIHIKQANVSRLEQAVLDSGNQKEIKKFAKKVKQSQMKKFLVLG